MRWSCFLLSCGAAMLAPAHAVIAARGPKPWPSVITFNDRVRLRTWREAWLLGLDQARSDGFAAAIEKEGALLDPDAALEKPEIPDGDYHCRVVKLGRRGMVGPAFSEDPGHLCRIADGHFAKMDGGQRPSGMVWPMDATRWIFLGAMALGDEPRALDYGRDTDRDMVGVIERIGPARWRMVLPRPHWESQLDVIELLPEAAAPAG